MTDYKRMVSYMYQYENGTKRKNVGFARVEAKDGQCKITLHMQLLGQLDSIFPTYLIHRDSDNMELIYLGDTMLKNQVMDGKLTADEKNIMDSGYGLSEMGGLLLFLNDNVFFATEWDNKPIAAKEVLEALKPKVRAEAKLTLQQELLIPKYKLPRGYKIIERLQKPGAVSGKDTAENHAAAEDRKVNDIVAENPEVAGTIAEGTKAADVTAEDTQAAGAITEDTEVSGTTAEDTKAADMTAENWEADNTIAKDTTDSLTEKAANKAQYSENNSVPQDADRDEAVKAAPDPKAAADIFEKNPRIYPFEDNEILICAKIEPKDIGLLPKELWTLSNNSFLMHGYYCYHHLIFAKLKDRFGCRYILGVPGIYHSRERFMAKMFGFDSFKPIRKRELRQGDFGYWHIPVIF